MKWIKSLSAVLCICMLVTLAGCNRAVENKIIPTDGPGSAPAESITPSLAGSDESIAESPTPSPSGKPAITGMELLGLFELVDSPNGPMLYEQNLSYKHMVDVMGFEYEEKVLDDNTLGYIYSLPSSELAFHYNRDGGPFDYIYIEAQSEDDIYDFGQGLNSHMSYDDLSAKIDELNQNGSYYGTYFVFDDDATQAAALWATLEYQIVWRYQDSNFSKPSFIDIWNSNLWAYTSDLSGWTEDFVFMENSTGEFNYDQYLINAEEFATMDRFGNAPPPSEYWDEYDEGIDPYQPNANTANLPTTAYYMFGKAVGEYQLGSDGLYHKTIFSWGWFNNQVNGSRRSSSDSLPARQGEGGFFLPETIDPNAGYRQCPKGVVNGAWDSSYSN